MKKQNTKKTILEKGSQIVHKKGFNHTGIKEILDAAGVPKGSFYHYFKNKEDFGLSLLDYYTEFFAGRTTILRDNKNMLPVQRLKFFFDGFLNFFENNGCELGCPIGNISQEMGDLSKAFRNRLENIFSMMRSSIEDTLNEAKKRGQIPDSINAEDTADFIINSWEGALLRMKVKKNTQPLYVFDRMIFKGILKQ
jgi:TetR/AcrR family transcriptional repressor of nem operon